MKAIAKKAFQVLAIGGFALIANGLAARPAAALMSASCDQRYAYCVEDAASTFQCCMYQTDLKIQVPLCELHATLTQNPKLTAPICGSQLAGAIGGCATQYGLCIGGLRPSNPTAK